MKALSIARKTLLEIWREPMLLLPLFIFPILLIGLYDIAYGSSSGGMAFYLNLLVLNEEHASPADAQPLGEALVEQITALEYEGQPVFTVHLVEDRASAEVALRERKAALLLVIPPDFTQAIQQAAQTSGRPAQIELVGDPLSDTYTFTRSFLEGGLREFAAQAAGQPESLALSYEFVPGTGTMSDFDFGVPGMIVFSIMLLVVSVAMVMVRENVAGTLRRLRLTRLSAAQMLLGVSLAHGLLAVGLVPLTLAAALAFGFQSHGSLLLAMFIGLLLSFSAIGLGLIVACFARSDSDAANLGASVGVIMVLLTDAMYPVPDATIAHLGGRAIQLYDLLPPSPAAEALRRILIFGDGLDAVAYELTLLALMAVVFFGAGVVLYQKLQMK